MTEALSPEGLTAPEQARLDELRGVADKDGDQHRELVELTNKGGRRILELCKDCFK